MLADSTPPFSRSAPVMILLHGSGLGSWIWEAVHRHLSHPHVALDVPSRRTGTDPERCARDLLSDPRFPSEGPVVLVLHSLSGVLESALANALGNRLVQVIHLASVVPQAGRTFADTMGFPTPLILRLLFWRNPQGLSPSPSMLKNQLCNDLDAQESQRVVERFQGEYSGLFLEPVPEGHSSIHRAYLVCSRDQSVPPRLQRAIAQRLGAAVREMDCGHLPMLSRPEALAGFLAQAAGKAIPDITIKSEFVKKA